MIHASVLIDTWQIGVLLLTLRKVEESMKRDKVVNLDEYRKAKKASSSNLTTVIEGHLAEAGFWEEEPDELWRYLDGNFKFPHDYLKIVPGKDNKGELPTEQE